MTLRKVGLKKLAAGQKYPNLRRSRIKKKARPAKKTERIYGPKARREFVKSLPCAACNLEGHSVNAHVAPSCEKGTGYKAGYRFIAPLCDSRYVSDGSVSFIIIGCHELYDRFREKFDMLFPAFDAKRAAEATQKAWEEYQQEDAK